jgi:Fe-S-cluster containining protein
MLEDHVVECMLNYLNLEFIPIAYKEFMSAVNTSWQVGELSNWPIIQLRTDNKCEFCSPSKCCQYVTQKIPSPRSKNDFRQLLWQVSHEKIKVFKDSDGWNLLFDTPCTHLQPDGRCGIYECRPPVCCDYSVKYCEFDASAEEGWELSFKDYESLLKYCTWRFQRWEVV